ncbi:hypothetical protein F4804DRAFT_315325 [Jackrogersella minutella]|nr:hypothetical protein F4804DRAFT_315325 [Jackrogersella minutella]
MPSDDDILTDDHVADLLVQEAKDCSIKYSAMGLDAFKPTKRPANQPKPNTRFLNNIIRDTNSHNRALLAKESAESKAKLRDLEHAEERKQREEERMMRKTKPGPGDTRKRMLGDIAAILGGSSKRRRTEKPDTSANNASESTESGPREKSSHRHRKSHATNGDADVKQEKEISRKDRGKTSRHSHRREASQEPGPSSSTRDRKHRGCSPRRESHRRLSTTKRSKRRASTYSSSSDSSDCDSDPLDEIIGPAPAKTPAVKRRGRGATATTSGIDSRFAPDYDPRTDVTPEPEGKDDWDQALEALRDRQKWKKQGADRLRSAGFTEAQIKKWEKGDQKDEADVQWTTAGGLREWDRGKIVNKDGTVSFSKTTEE